MPRTEEGTRRWGLFLRMLAVRLVVFFFGFSILITLLFSFLPVPLTPLMLIRCVEQMNDPKKEVRLEKDWKGFHSISNNLKLAVICAEDQNYFQHNGFDFQAIDKALNHNKKSSRKRGASTISQQTAKNVFLWPARSWIRKGLEVYFTLLIETLWSKKRIMTMYLNVAEFGDGIYGAEAAAQHYFKKSAVSLNRSEAALLASILPNPRKYSAKRPGPYVRKRQAWVLNQMRMWGNSIDFDNPITPKKKN
ncbi:MAG: monofunctional biosynthetic peptidoglycan transglycosylase [Saprospiraceae bacterium]